MKTLEQMCHVLNRLLDVSPDMAESLLRASASTSDTAQSLKLIDDQDIVVRLTDDGVELTLLLLVNSLVSEVREGRDWSIFRDVNEATGETICFFAAPVNRTRE